MSIDRVTLKLMGIITIMCRFNTSRLRSRRSYAMILFLIKNSTVLLLEAPEVSKAMSLHSIINEKLKSTFGICLRMLPYQLLKPFMMPWMSYIWPLLALRHQKINH